MTRPIAAAGLFLLAAAASSAADPCELGVQALEGRDLDSARIHLQKCLDARPATVEPYLWLCALHQARQDSTALYQTARLGLEKFPQERRFYLTVGTHDAREKRYQAAIDAFEEGLRRWPEDAQIRSLLASSHFARGTELLDASDSEAAAKHLRRATEMAPADVEAHLNLGRAFHNLLRNTEALAAFDRVIELQPATPLAFFHRGMTYHSLGEFERAIEDLDQAIAAAPDYPPAYLVRGLAQLAVARWEPALGDLETATARMPRNAQAWHGRARALVQLERLPEAEKSLRTAMELDPTEPAPLNALVAVLMRLGRAEEARPLAVKAAALARERRSADPGEIRFEGSTQAKP
ncbi:MAG: tetratricopeptide repeat protein [Bryobacterales bacterium]